MYFCSNKINSYLSTRKHDGSYLRLQEPAQGINVKVAVLGLVLRESTLAVLCFEVAI